MPLQKFVMSFRVKGFVWLAGISLLDLSINTLFSMYVELTKTFDFINIFLVCNHNYPICKLWGIITRGWGSKRSSSLLYRYWNMCTYIEGLSRVCLNDISKVKCGLHLNQETNSGFMIYSQ